MRPHRIAIIGLGSRGLTILERIIAFVSQSSSQPLHLELHIFEPRLPGSGCHDHTQASHLLVNTVASQITQFSDESVKDAGPILSGPSFFEWLKQQEKSLDEVAANQYFSRALFGSYLHWVFLHLKQIAPPHINIIMHQAYVNDCVPQNKNKWRIVSDAKHLDVDFVFLTTGHTTRKLKKTEMQLQTRVKRAKEMNPLLDIIFDPYPISALSKINCEHTVAIEGAGLTAFDIISELTIGRGGEFKRDKVCVYKPSGFEPKILLFSRSGLPLTSRAVNQKGVHGQYKARFLTLETIATLKHVHLKLDFKQHILPLLLLDMAYIYYVTHIKNRYDDITAAKFADDFVYAQSDEARQRLITRYFNSEDYFSFDKLTQPIPDTALKSQECFATWLNDYLHQDLAEAYLGNITSPLKAACDVLRDVRDTLRYAIDFAGLTPKSHRWLINDFVPTMNRLAVGPPKERIEELLALIDAQIVKFDFGPAARWQFDDARACFQITSTQFDTACDADVLIQARIALPGPYEDNSRLMQNLLERGIVRSYQNGDFFPGGIEIDSHLNVVNGEGHALSNMWALGTLTEGCKFYTFVVPRPGVNSKSIVDASIAVKQMLHLIQQSQVENLVLQNVI